MASLLENLNTIKAALDDVDSKPNPIRKRKFYEALRDDLKPRKQALEAALEAYEPSDPSEISGSVCNSDGEIIATVEDGVVKLLP